MRAVLPALLLLGGCNQAVYLQSGTYTLVRDRAPVAAAGAEDAPELTLTLDQEARTWALALEGGATVEGSWAPRARTDWSTCCYLNQGHFEFETATLTPGVFTLGWVDMRRAWITADGPTLFEASAGAFEPEGWEFE
ncbi:MAG: hypothetical protein H6732_14005 [Alphaproteobacteria bacterium]|nr:hypothetical protein [Alphaproteobacteria bacterium]